MSWNINELKARLICVNSALDALDSLEYPTAKQSEMLADYWREKCEIEKELDIMEAANV